MKFNNIKFFAILVLAINLSSCELPSSNSFKNNIESINSKNNSFGSVNFKFDFPEKFYSSTSKINIKAINLGLINRVNVKVSSATSDYFLERKIDLVPGGIDVSFNLPLDKLYIVTVTGLNDNDIVSGTEMKGFFRLDTSTGNNSIEINQTSTPIAKILELLSDEKKGTEDSNVQTEVVDDENSTEEENESTNNIIDVSKLNLEKLSSFVELSRGSFHPSFVNVDILASEIKSSNGIPINVPENSITKPGSIKGTITGLKHNEIAVVTVNDPASNQAIVVSPILVGEKGEALDPDKVSSPIEFFIDNVTPGEWNLDIVSSGYVRSDLESINGFIKPLIVNVSSDTELSQDFVLTSTNWIRDPINVSGNIGASDHANVYLDNIDNMHLVWRQDGFNTDSNSGSIFYSKWNKTSWSTQEVNISKDLKGSKNPSVAVSLDRIPHIVWSSKDSSGSRGVYYSKFDSSGWIDPILLPNSSNGDLPIIKVDKSNGFLYSVWESENNIYMSRYDNKEWSSAINISNGIKPNLEVDSNGIVHIVWKNIGNQSISYANWENNKLSSSEFLNFDNIGIDTNNSLDIKVDRFNRVHVIWSNSEYVQYIFRGNSGSWSNSEIVNQISNSFFEATTSASLSIAPTGIINVVWASKTTDNQEVIRFRRRLNNGWKEPFKAIVDPNSLNSGEATVLSTDNLSENKLGYQDIPLSQINEINGKPLLVNDYSGRIHVIWSNKTSSNNNDSDILHSIKQNQTN